MSTDTPIPATNLPDDPDLLKQINRELLDLVAKLQHDKDKLQQQLDQLRRRLFGHKSEKLNPHQLLLFPELAAAAPSDIPLSPPPPTATESPKRRGHGRNGLNPKLRRERRVYVLDDHERRCPCGGLCEKFGEEISEQLDYLPASLFVIEHVRTKYACPQCHDQILVAVKPEQPIAKGLPGPGLLAQVITCKYADHIPLNRFENICRRQGVALSRSTLCDWTKASADLLTPLYDLMVSLVLASRSVHTDDTLCAELGIVRAGCWAHARRHFYDARDSAPGPVAEALARIGRLYAVEKEIKATLAERELTGVAADAPRLAVRHEKAVPELTTLCQWLEQQRAAVLPKSPLGQAVQYALNHWESLLRYTQHGFLAIDNNAAERALRPIAVGRNNWLFVGSATGGQTAAVLFSFTSTCRRLNLDPFAHLRDTLACLAAGPLSADELALLLPHRWTPSTNS